MSGAIPLHPHYAFIAWCLVKHRNNFAFYLYLYHVSKKCLRNLVSCTFIYFANDILNYEKCYLFVAEKTNFIFCK